MRRSAASLLSLLVLVGCTRPLTSAETAFADVLFGDAIDTAEVRVAQNIGLLPPRARAQYRPRHATPRADPCHRVPRPPGPWSPAAFVLGNTIFLHGPTYSPETVLGWPDQLRLPHALVMAHELAHVWQWQNRSETGYSPAAAVAEGLRAHDAYFYEITPGRPFAAYGYEQQATLIEDYLCFLVLDPSDPKRFALRDVLAPVIAVDRLDATIDAVR